MEMCAVNGVEICASDHKSTPHASVAVGEENVPSRPDGIKPIMYPKEKTEEINPFVESVY